MDDHCDFPPETGGPSWDSASDLEESGSRWCGWRQFVSRAWLLELEGLVDIQKTKPGP
jgi:hypothetical protein